MEKPEKIKRRYFTQAQKVEILRARTAGHLTYTQLAGKYKLYSFIIK